MQGLIRPASGSGRFQPIAAELNLSMAWIGDLGEISELNFARGIMILPTLLHKSYRVLSIWGSRFNGTSARLFIAGDKLMMAFGELA